MRPKDLKSPFSWEGRKVLIQDRIWHVPNYYDDPAFVFPGWEAQELFGNDKPVKVEFCSGNGCWIVEKAKAHPEYNWVAVELKFKRVRKIWSKIKNHELDNLIAVCGEGLNISRRYIPNESVEEVFVNFPDPWPKDRHAKHRIIKASFADEVARILTPTGTITMVTDDPPYSEQMSTTFQKHETFRADLVTPKSEEYGNSYFHQLWVNLGRNIHFHRFAKQEAAT